MTREWSYYERGVHFLAMITFVWILVSAWQSGAWLVLKIVATPPLLFAIIMAGRGTFGSRLD